MKMRKLYLFYFLFSVLINLQQGNSFKSEERSFYIDYEKNTFIKDGKPFRYVSGSIHAYRVPKDLWEDRLRKMWAAGLNAIQTYIYWNVHEPRPGVYDFTNQNNIFEFIELAQKIGFVMILRPGPFVCAEHDFGGLPWWLLSNGTDTIIPRSSEVTYFNAVIRWFKVLLPLLQPYLYKNGGPIITVQVENEYGYYYKCDKNYMGALRDMFHEYLGNDTVLFTTDPHSAFLMICGTITGVYPTVDFGVEANVDLAFFDQRIYAPKGPLVNSEFYPGWLDKWGSAHEKRSTESILKSFNHMMSLGANVNFYMFHGGTNFGYSNGANKFILYNAQPTSYDYDAPISEAGDVTDKFLKIREAISQYLALPNVSIPVNSTKISYGKIPMTYYLPLVEVINALSHNCINSSMPLTFEQLGQGYGFILYSTTLDNPNVKGKVLSIPGIRDRAYIQIGTKSVGVIYINGPTSLTINLDNNENTDLHIIVENMGRYNAGDNMLDAKGIVSNVFLDNEILTGWTMCLTDDFVPNFQKKYSNNQMNLVKILKKPQNKLASKFKAGDLIPPAVYMGQFDSKSGDYDTFLKNDKFTKGVAIVGTDKKLTNLGRYWPNYGPQVTLYTPSAFIEPNYQNNVILIEFEGSLCTKSISDCLVEFIDYPIIG